MTDVKSQYQEGDRVVYVAEGILTKISGYVWEKKYSEDETPKLAGYQLSCGIAATASEFRRATRLELYRLDPAETLDG